MFPGATIIRPRKYRYLRSAWHVRLRYLSKVFDAKILLDNDERHMSIIQIPECQTLIPPIL